MAWWKRKKRLYGDIAPDEIFLDAANLPNFDRNQFEGRIEKPIPKKTIFSLGMFFAFMAIIFVTQVSVLQIFKGEAYFKKSENNTLDESLVKTKAMNIQVETQGEITRGKTVADRYFVTDRKPNALVGVEVDRKRFVDLMKLLIEKHSK